MKFLKTISQIVAGGTFTGAAPNGVLAVPAAGIAPNAVLYAYAAGTVGGLFDFAVAEVGSCPAKSRSLERFTVSLAASVAWTLSIFGADGVARVTNFLAQTSQYFTASGIGFPLAAGEYLVFSAATTGTVSAATSEDA